MVEKITNGALSERRGIGQELYVEGMKKSGPDKAKIIPYVKPGVIVEGGPGSGVVTEMMWKEFPGSEFYAVDISKDMVRRLEDKFKNQKNIKIVEHDIKTFDPGVDVDTYVHSSNLHEVASVGGREAVIATLKNEYEHTKRGGRIVIRDGVRPEPETVFVKPKTDFGADRFLKFIGGFKKVRNVSFQTGSFDPDSLEWNEGKSVKIIPEKTFIKMHSQDASELFSKYFYPEINLPVELSEQFGIWTLEEYKKVLENVGYRVIHAESYLLPFLLETHYSQDFEYFHLKNGVLSNAPYPDSTMLLVGEK